MSPSIIACGGDVIMPPSDCQFRNGGGMRWFVVEAAVRSLLFVGQLVHSPLRNSQCKRSLRAPTAKTSTEDSPERTARGGDMTVPPRDCHPPHVPSAPSEVNPFSCAHHN